MESLISVIVPIYNVEKYLDKCIESITNQTYRNLEIILIDDGSTDNCLQLCEGQAKTDKRIRVVSKENAGIGMARNLGLQIATGEYVMFVDSDDWLRSDAIETLYKMTVKYESDMAVSDYVTVDEFGNEASSPYILPEDCLVSAETVFRQMGTELELPISVWGKLFKRDVIKDLKFTQLPCAEDLVMLASTIVNCKKVSFTSKVTYYYFQRSNSITHTKSDKMIMGNVEGNLLVADLFYKHGIMENAKAYYKRSIFFAVQAKKKTLFLRCFKNIFSYNERKILLEKNIRVYFRWYSLYIPFLYDFVQNTKKLIQKFNRRN